MSTTTLGIENYQIGKLLNDSINYFNIGAERFQKDSVEISEYEDLIIGPSVEFEIEEYDLDDIVSILVEFEREHEMSTIQMFSQYLQGEFRNDENIERWFDIFILFLGTKEVHQYSCV